MNRNKMLLKAHCLKLNCAENSYKGKYICFPKFFVDNNAKLKFEKFDDFRA